MPERTCLGCRAALAKDALVRYVVGPDHRVLVDYRARLPGRGAYTCVSATCVAAAVKRQQFRRAFRSQAIQVDLQDLQRQLAQAIFDRAVALIGMARKAGQLVAGVREVEAAFGSSAPPKLLIVAADASEGTCSSLLRAAARKQVRVARLLSRETLGQLVGKSLTSVVAIPPGDLAAHIVEELDRYQTVLGES